MLCPAVVSSILSGHPRGSYPVPAICPAASGDPSEFLADRRVPPARLGVAFHDTTGTGDQIVGKRLARYVAEVVDRYGKLQTFFLQVISNPGIIDERLPYIRCPG